MHTSSPPAVIPTNPAQTAGNLTAAALLAVRGRSEATTSSYRSAMRSFVAWAEEREESPSASCLAGYLEALRASGASAAKVNLTLYGGKAALEQAALSLGMSGRELALLKGALDGLKGSRRGAPEIRVVSPEERLRLFAAMPFRVRLLSRFLYATGCRVSEAIAVRPEQCRAGGERVLIRLVGKGRAERIVRIPVSLYSAIEEGFGSSKSREYLFETRFGNRFTRQYVSREIERAAKRILGRTVTAHDLRHSRGTDLYARTRDLKGIAELLGHTDTSTTARYYVRSSLSDEDLFGSEAL